MGKIITQARLKELFSYDPETGVFTRLVTVNSQAKAGDIATCRSRYGYTVFRVDGRLYRANRMAHLYMTGELPRHQVDHINGMRSDDRWVNLRDVMPQKNAQNSRVARPGNKSGLLGVSPNRNRFSASIVVSGKKTHLGTFDTAEIAHEAYVSAKRQLHAGCTI